MSSETNPQKLLEQCLSLFDNATIALRGDLDTVWVVTDVAFIIEGNQVIATFTDHREQVRTPVNDIILYRLVDIGAPGLSDNLAPIRHYHMRSTHLTEQAPDHERPATTSTPEALKVMAQGGYVTPTRAHPSDAGIDLRASRDVNLPGGHRALVPTGISIALPHGTAGLVVPRSGLANRHGVTVLNSPGVIDESYRGEVMVNLLNTSQECFRAGAGERIAQLLVVPVLHPEIVLVDRLPDHDDDRGLLGHGSTGNK